MNYVDLGYRARSAFRGFHGRDKRWAVLVVHRRGGKTVAGINDLVRGALACNKISPRFGYIAPYRQQAKLVAWDYLKRATAKVQNRQISESELHIKLPRDGRVTLYGADNYDALRGIYLDGVVVDEPADMKPEVWTDLLRPALSDRCGWCVWIGTPKGRNGFFRLYDKACSDPEFFTMLLKASESGILPPEELESARKAMGNESYDREYECSFNASVPGAIYGETISQIRRLGQIQDFPANTEFPLFTSWDVGDSDYCSQWLFQFEGRHINLIDFYSATGETPGHYAAQIKKWEDIYRQPIMRHYLPHDAANITHGSSWKLDLEKAGMRRIEIVHRTPWVWDGINHLRSLLPRCYIHKTNCSKTQGSSSNPLPSGLDCLEMYSKHEVEEGHNVKEDPVHNEFSHGADALRTFAEADKLGMIPGTSLSHRREVGAPGPKVISGASPTSYSIKHPKSKWSGKVLS